MSNSIGSLNGNLIAQAGLDLLLNSYPILGQIATDFSSEPAQKGQTIVTRIPSLVSVQDWSDANGYEPTGAVSTDASVTLNKFKHATVEITDAEYSSTNRDLTKEFAAQAFPALGNAIMADIAALWTSGNYANATTCPVASGSFNTVIVDPNIALSARNAKGTFGVFNSSLYGQLWKDPVVSNVQYKGVGISATELPVLQGVTVSQYQDLPSLSQGLIGVVGGKDSIVMAARLPSDAGFADLPAVGRVSTVVDPRSGLAVQVRESYNMQKGRRYITFALIYGVSVGNSASLQRIKSA